MNALVQEITLKIQDLPPEELVKVREFIEFIAWKQQHPLPETRPPETEAAPKLTHEAFERLADELAETFQRCFENGAPVLPDEAISREGIYGDHL